MESEDGLRESRSETAAHGGGLAGRARMWPMQPGSVTSWLELISSLCSALSEATLLGMVVSLLVETSSFS